MTLALQTERMQATIEDGVGWMIFNNPARHNALSLEMWQGIGDILEHYAANDGVRCVIMRGAGGKAFVSGADISEFDTKRATAAQKDEYAKIAGRATRWLNRTDKPLIALIEGYCIGGGLATASPSCGHCGPSPSIISITRIGRSTCAMIASSFSRYSGVTKTISVSE